jgi:Kef-type K+ transport system membrane component KefB/nucleotide-binding universal stress UspA family protein
MKTETLVLIDILLVLGLSRLVGVLCRWLQQPLVIGEIIAGIMLGPSLFGWMAPTIVPTLFSPEVIGHLKILSNIGLIFFMFLIGLELNPSYLKGQIKTAIVVSQVSIVVPFVSGVGLAMLLYPPLAPAGVSFMAFALFLGAAMSITAFPVLARILTEKNLQNTRLGTLALTCAAVDDITAWCILAVAIAVTRTNSLVAAVPTIAMAILYVVLMLTIGRRLLGGLETLYNRSKRLTPLLLAGIYGGVVVSALITEHIHIHLIFGAFLLGAIMPKNEDLTREIAEKTEDFVLIFLLPIFFAYSGLRTQIGSLNQPILWGYCGAILLVAIGGKYIGTYIAARLCKLPHRDASALGALMNTRGLTELILLNIGLELGVISTQMFTMLVIMALTTTVMTSPWLEWIYPKRQIQADSPATLAEPTYRILVPVANPKSQPGLIQMATALAFAPDVPPTAAIYPLSLIELAEDYSYASTPDGANRSIQIRKSRLDELIQRSQPDRLHPWIRPIVQLTSDVGRETNHIAQQGNMDLVLLGWHRPSLTNNRLGGKVGQILGTVPTDVAVFVDRDLDEINRILVPYSASIHDDLAVELALRLLANGADRRLTLLRISAPNQLSQGLVNDLSFELRSLWETLPASLLDRVESKQIESGFPLQTVIHASANVDLTIVGASPEWGIERQSLGRYTDELTMECESSLVVTRRYSRVASHLRDLAKDRESAPI